MRSTIHSFHKYILPAEHPSTNDRRALRNVDSALHLEPAMQQLKSAVLTDLNVNAS